MKNLYNVKLFTLMFLFLFAGFLTACEDDDVDPSGGQVQLLSFGPSGVQHGEEIRFIGRNLNKVESIELPGVSVPKSAFKSQTAEEIVLVVPQEATEGKVTLKTTEGDVTSKSILSFEVPVVINSVTEQAKPGTNITVTGSKVNWITGVVFDKDTVSEFVSQSLEELVLQVPMTAKTGKLVFITGGTEPLVIESEEELIVTLPTATALAPEALKHGETLTVTGTDLDLVKEIIFPGGTSVAEFVSQSETQLEVIVPDNATGGTLILVAHSLEEVTTEAELTIILPAATNIAPTPVSPGENLTITGTNFDLVKSVVFGGGTAVSEFVSQNPTTIVVKVPANVRRGFLKFITHRDYEVMTTQEVRVVGETGPDISYFIYDDALNAEWQKWDGWGMTTQDMENTEVVSRGTKAIKVVYNDDYGALQLHPNNANALAGYSHVVLYVYGGSGNNKMALRVKTTAGVESPEPTFDLVQGEWQTIEIPISEFGDISAGVAELLIKNYGANPNTVYIDDIGLR